MDIKKKKELCDNYDSNYYGAVGVLMVIKIAQKYKIELPDRLTFRNSMDKKQVAQNWTLDKLPLDLEIKFVPITRNLH